MSGEVALFGGSFDPLHLGHVWVVAQVLALEDVEAVWLLPTHTHAFGKRLAPFEDRLEMCRSLVSVFGERVEVSDLERRLAREGRPSYTAETLEALQEAHPGRRFALVVGADVLAELDGWHRPERVRELARLLVVGRAGDGSAGPRVDVSSTWLRARLAAGEDVRGWVPRAVHRLIAERGLYR